MTVEELIKKYEKVVRDYVGITSYKEFLDDLKQIEIIEHNQKVKVPKFVAEWIEEAKERGLCIQFVLEPGSDLQSEEVKEWLDWHNHRNQEVCVRAFLDGYEVEEEPKYYVKLPIVVWDEFESELKDESVYLKYDITSDETRFSETMDSYKDFKAKLTEGTIKHIDERYWPFAVPVEKEVSE